MVKPIMINTSNFGGTIMSSQREGRQMERELVRAIVSGQGGRRDEGDHKEGPSTHVFGHQYCPSFPNFRHQRVPLPAGRYVMEEMHAASSPPHRPPLHDRTSGYSAIYRHEPHRLGTINQQMSVEQRSYYGTYPRPFGSHQTMLKHDNYLPPSDCLPSGLPPMAPSYPAEDSKHDSSRKQEPSTVSLPPASFSRYTVEGEWRKQTVAGPDSTPARILNDKETGCDNAKRFMSPITLCFDRMLGAADYLASNPTPDHVKKELAVNMKHDLHLTDSIKNENVVAKRKSNDKENGDGNDPGMPQLCKRARHDRPFFTTTEQVRKLNERNPQNPFAQLLNEEDLYYRIILIMTLEAENKEMKKPSDLEAPASKMIGDGFYWKSYPELESLLYKNMHSYYSVSVSNRQSRVQQNFNNHLVSAVRSTAEAAGYTFDASFTDKRIRDRIRCFYKTHLQNAKKRLATMQKNPTSVLNQAQLRLWIEEARAQMKAETMSVGAQDGGSLTEE